MLNICYLCTDIYILNKSTLWTALLRKYNAVSTDIFVLWFYEVHMEIHEKSYQLKIKTKNIFLNQ